MQKILTSRGAVFVVAAALTSGLPHSVQASPVAMATGNTGAAAAALGGV